jgi:hypothetical protein
MSSLFEVAYQGSDVFYSEFDDLTADVFFFRRWRLKSTCVLPFRKQYWEHDMISLFLKIQDLKEYGSCLLNSIKSNFMCSSHPPPRQKKRDTYN